MTFAPLDPLLRAALVLVASLAGVLDIRTRRIPNWLVLAGMAAGFGLQFYLKGPPGLLTAAKGCGLAFAVYLPLWLLRGMGAGDVKLMAALGAISGASAWFLIFLASSILGAVAGLVLAARHGRLGSTLASTFTVASELLKLRAPWHAKPEVDYHHPNALRMPHGAIIAAAIIVLAAAKVI
jgi:prepilin peptidase CpaA